MSLLLPFVIGVVQGLLLFWPVLAFGIAYRLFKFPDVSVEGSFLIGGCVYAGCTRAGLPVVVGVAAAAGAAALIGATTALLHAKLRINKFMAGILVTAACYTVALRLLNRSNVGLTDAPSAFRLAELINNRFGFERFDGGSLLLLSFTATAGLFVLRQWLMSRPGLRLRVGAMGGCPASNLQLPHVRLLVAGLAATGALSGLGGSLVVMKQTFFDLSMNQGVLILGLASLTLGERIVPQGARAFVVRTLAACMAGSVAYQVILAYAIRAGANPADLRLVTTVLVLAALVIRGPAREEEILES